MLTISSLGKDMAFSRNSLNATTGLRQSKGVWRDYLLKHFDVFALLAGYLVADERQVKHVMECAASRLQGTPFDKLDPSRNFTKARRAIIDESVIVLNQQTEKESK